MKSYSDTDVDQLDHSKIMLFQRKNDYKKYQWYLQRKKERETYIITTTILIFAFHLITNVILSEQILCSGISVGQCLPWYYLVAGAIFLYFEWKYFFKLIKWYDDRDYQKDMEAAQKKFTPEQVKRLKNIIKYGWYN